MTQQGRGPQPKVDPDRQLFADLRARTRWCSDKTDQRYYLDPTSWWADPSLLVRLGPALAALFSDESPTLVLGPQSRGALLGALTAQSLGIGLVEMRKDPGQATDSDAWRIAHTPPDYRDRTLRVGIRRGLVQSGDRVLLVDDVIDTGGQALAAKALVDEAGATWCGVAAVFDLLADPALRYRLTVRSLLRE